MPCQTPMFAVKVAAQNRGICVSFKWYIIKEDFHTEQVPKQQGLYQPPEDASAAWASP